MGAEWKFQAQGVNCFMKSTPSLNMHLKAIGFVNGFCKKMSMSVNEAVAKRFSKASVKLWQQGCWPFLHFLRLLWSRPNVEIKYQVLNGKNDKSKDWLTKFTSDWWGIIKWWSNGNQENTWVIGKSMGAVKYSSSRQWTGLLELTHERKRIDVKRWHLTLSLCPWGKLVLGPENVGTT